MRSIEPCFPSLFAPLTSGWVKKQNTGSSTSRVSRHSFTFCSARRRDTRDRARHGCVTRARHMESIARIVCVDAWGLARAPRVRRACDSRPASRRAASVPPPGATRRGWGDTDSRFSRLDRRGEERGDDRGDRGDADRNISFQELRKRQDREQRKVSTPSSRRRLIRAVPFPHSPTGTHPFTR